jgi:hypothetical protein
MGKADAKPGDDKPLVPKSDAWTDLALTLPIFLAYHLGVAFLPMRNAADVVTTELRALANQSMLLYAGLTLGIGAVLVFVLFSLGQRKALDPRRFALVAIEGTLYAVLMRTGSEYVVGKLPLGPLSSMGPFPSVVMALGAGFYEEIAFRVTIFGVVSYLAGKVIASKVSVFIVRVFWALVVAALFSGWHYLGPSGDKFELESFVFRAVCGLMLTTIYAFRGFAPAVWTHAIYDLWVMVF